MLVRMDESAVIQVERLTRRYAGRPGYEAVRGVDFSVRRGELFALLGTNGAGKTSTLEVLEGLAPPTSGTVRVLGKDPYRDRRTVRPRIGIMLQDRGFAADLTVAETTKMWTGTLTSPRPVGEILEQVELTTRAECPGPPVVRRRAATSRASASRSPAARTCCSSTNRPPASIRRTGRAPGS